mmetsp:Transcript_2555/g.5383  ORF Transcript_2555/g.5383 Transcript_2555/m.5383 type:complete len:258 (+) Transcript_2555:150-923(+)
MSLVKSLLIVHHVLGCGTEFLVSLDDLVDALEKILFRHTLAPRPNRKHARLGANTVQFGTRGIRTQSCNEFEPNVSIAVHALRMNLENVPPSLQIGQSEFDLAIQSARSHQSRIERIGPIRGHQNLNVSSRVESIQFRDNLEHGPLDLVVGSIIVASATGSTDSIDLIKENNAGSLGTCHGKEFPDHSCSLTNIFLNEFGSNHTNETRVGTVGHRTGRQRLPGTGRPIQQNTLGRFDAQGDKALWVKQRQLKNFSEL